jgi:protein-S-isoprenylcysteine O-methyltransferase Ste14
MNSSDKLIPYLAIGLSSLFGVGPLILFTIFLYKGPFGFVDFGLGDLSVLFWDALLSLVFFGQHSTMIRKSFRKRLASIVPLHYHGVFYSVASGIVLLTLMLLWQESPQYVFQLEGWARWCCRAVFFMSMAGMMWGVLALGSFDPLGIGPILAHLRGRQVPSMPLTARGPYRWVRHPLYSFTLLLIWAYPDLSVARLLFNVSWTAWVVVGTWLEERDLVAEFGEAYGKYQQEVPMLFPWRLRPPM